MKDEYDRDKNGCCEQCSIHYDAPDGKNRICGNPECKCHGTVKPRVSIKERMPRTKTWPHR